MIEYALIIAAFTFGLVLGLSVGEWNCRKWRQAAETWKEAYFKLNGYEP